MKRLEMAGAVRSSPTSRSKTITYSHGGDDWGAGAASDMIGDHLGTFRG